MRFFVLLCSMLLVVSCSKPSERSASAVLSLYQDERFSVQLSPADAPVEQILTWKVQLADGWHIYSAKVTGVSMNMGTIPLQFDAVPGQSGLYHAEMVLGACSAPKMQWQLQLQLAHPEQTEQQLLLPFYSSWPE